MKCLEKECNYRQLNGGDELSDFYYCTCFGMSAERGDIECFVDKYDGEEVVERQSILIPGTIVAHFKRECVPQDVREFSDKYLYRVIGVALDTVTNNMVVVYEALYDDEDMEFSLFVRPLDEFMSKVDKQKYPDIKNVYRFSKYTGD